MMPCKQQFYIPTSAQRSCLKHFVVAAALTSTFIFSEKNK